MYMSSLEEGSVIAGKYRLERLLSQGGMGAVWTARHLTLDVPVAVKLMAPAFAASAEGRARFEREAKASAHVKSPYVVQVHDYGLEGETPYIVMELLEGEDLDARLRREGRLTPAATLSVVTQVCKALRALHEKGIVHRDLKPANIFLTRQGGDELVKILDFGIAKATGPILAGDATKTGTLLGSPYYMSPEQVRRSKDVDWRSDLWSLGVIIFRCLTGRLPWEGEEIGDLFVEIATDPIPIASQIAPDLGPDVDRFIARALTRERDKRFQSADELSGALAAVVASSGKRPHEVSLGSAVTVAAGPALTHVAAGAPLGLHAPHAAENTLGPSGHTIAPMQGRARAPWGALAVLGGALALAITAFTILRSPAGEGEATPNGEPAARPPAAEPAAPAPAAPLSAGTAGSAESDPPKNSAESSASPAVTAAPSAAPSASASALPAPSNPVKRATPQRAPRPTKEDPRDHM